MEEKKTFRISVVLAVALAAFAFVASNTCANADLIPGMVSYWQFEEGGGTTASDSVGTNHGTLVGDPVWIPGQVGGALDLDDDDYVRVPHNSSLNPGTGSFSFATWIRPPEILEPPFQVRVIFKVEVGPVWLGYNLDFSSNGNFSFCLGDGAEGSGVSGSPCEGFIAGNWYHVASVRDKDEGTLKIYVNGVERSVVTDNTGNVSTTKDLIIGKRYEADTDYTGTVIEPFIGALDEVAIFNKALSGSEICGMYTNGLAGEGYTVPDEPSLVHFDDAALKAAVEEILDITDPTQCDMLCLEELDATNRGIIDLTGLEYAKNLINLNLNANQISDLTPISGLINLKELRLYKNQISDISPISGLTNLEFLDLQKNQISVITPLSGLKNLTYLGMKANKISDITPVSGLTNLKQLELGGNKISNIGPVSGLTLLEDLSLNNNEISDITPLSELTNLRHLDLGGNKKISDITPVSGLTNLQYLYMEANKISNIGPLSGLKLLIELELNNNQISDISALSELMNLEFLELRKNPLNCEAYWTVIPTIVKNNPGINIQYNPMPPECLNQPPVADAGLDQTVERESCAGTEVTLNGSGSTDPDSTEGTNDDIVSFDWYEGETHLGSGEIIAHTFQLGTHNVTLKVTDSAGATDEDEVVIVVEDTTPPTINSLLANPDVLWPPNHKMVEVIVEVDATDICDSELVSYIVDVTSDEPINGPGDGNTEPDWEFTDDPLIILLRAERAGSGDTRVYTITIVCSDHSGNVAEATVDITVPHDQGKGKK